MSSSFLENYDLAEPAIRKLYDSKLRLAIIEALSKGPMRLADLRREIDANAPNTSTKAKDLEDMGVIERTDDGYALTPYGRAVRSRAQESFEFYATYAKFKGYWDSHDTSGIPDYLWARIGDLSELEMHKNAETDFTAVHDAFMEFLKSVKGKFYGVSPIFHKGWIAICQPVVESGIETRIVLKEDVFDLLQKYGLSFLEASAKNDVELYITDLDVPDAFTVTGTSLSYSSREKKPPFTCMDMEIAGASDRAVKWGMDLFEHYRMQSKPVKLSDYL